MDNLSLLFEPFMVRALLGAGAASVLAAALGCFVVWRQMAYFGDSLAHSSMLGVALGAVFGFSINLGLLGVAVVFALMLFAMQLRWRVEMDTLLGILAHGGLATALVLLAVWRRRIDLHAYLFGDILAVSWGEVALIAAGAVFGLGVLAVLWRGLVLLTLDENLARLHGIKLRAHQLSFLVLMALAVALSVRVVGVLLITALLIIPAATARLVARSPEGMAVRSVMLAVSGVVFGLITSTTLNAPAGPSIVMVTAAQFFVGLAVVRIVGR